MIDAARRVAFPILVVALQAACAARGTDLAESSPEINPSRIASQSTARTIIPQDLLQVTVFAAPELSAITRVSDTGEISLPLIGAVRAAGNTTRELERSLADRLRTSYMHDPHVSVEVKEEAAQPIYVLGEVNEPGAFTTSGQNRMTLLQAVSNARGFKPSAAYRRIVVIRTSADGERLQVPVNLDDVLKGRAPDMMLQTNDVVYVPKNTERAVALGLVDALLRVVTFRTVF
jgi:polysaccharide biosynthesis/export protein